MVLSSFFLLVLVLTVGNGSAVGRFQVSGRYQVLDDFGYVCASRLKGFSRLGIFRPPLVLLSLTGYEA